MDRIARKVVLVFAAAVLASGCGAPPINPPAVQEAATYKARANRGGLTVAVDPYADPDKSKAVFGLDMVSKGLLAVNLVFENAGEKKFFVYTNQLAFEDANGENHQRLQVSQVASAVEGKGFAQGGSAGGLSVSAVGLSSNADPSVAQRYLEVSLVGNLLPPKSQAHGFVFFELGKERLVTGTVVIPVHDTEEDRILVFEVPLP